MAIRGNIRKMVIVCMYVVNYAAKCIKFPYHSGQAADSPRDVYFYFYFLFGHEVLVLRRLLRSTGPVHSQSVVPLRVSIVHYTWKLWTEDMLGSNGITLNRMFYTSPVSWRQG